MVETHIKTVETHGRASLHGIMLVYYNAFS